ncbi:metal-dependent hydrolase [Acinetobacter bohemicus]|uniref:Metal-dependent hydrolase n=1 Tax=Acinetobacter lwoffii TaxID=28090 RepID=A0A9D2UUE9_ACILW|nr:MULTISPECIES: metal-dependent hydrolase [Acinetobacter]MDM1781931.1 metal-dependent hydrolase [Acinetobacter indicus]HJF28827.1 metal-dependent hydrolase [Acinetobacter lwoffii]MCO8041347.1 metal-dependent hydrolase [Acinetobacter sp. S4400-12]MCU7223518.1 metal-dependent hydrolase [Acinetobacter bohemicus]QKQ70799.1 metal-dependent hydrolase [Acinetobacter sp. 10FS3-1]
MNAIVKSTIQPVVRSNLDFKLDEIPRYWFGGDPFLTRMFDALSLTFPDGERYFILSVRLFRDQIKDPKLQQRVADFIRQEAQHGIAHDQMNDLMREQGMPVDQFISRLNSMMNRDLKYRSPHYNIAVTAAAEHLTALMAETFYAHKQTLAAAHPYVRALFAWHAIEEMEHRDVAFDVMKEVAQTPELTRKAALPFITVVMFGFTLYRANIMLKYDGFNRLQRWQMNLKGLPWFFGRKGVLTRMGKQYRDWFKADFHPSQHPVIAQYEVWVKTLEETNNPILAGEAFWQAAQA